MKVLVVGGSGFVGSYICRELISQGHEITIFAKEASVEVLSWLDSSKFIRGDLYSITDNDYKDILLDVEAVVFAAGADDRQVCKKPSYPFFEQANITVSDRLVKLAKESGICNFVFIGSYFVHFNNEFPDLNLSQTHPYIKSRVEQKRCVFDNLTENDSCWFIELPFVFGKVMGGEPLWKPLIKYLDSGWPIFAPSGGTAVVAIDEVAETVAQYLNKKNGLGTIRPVNENLSWKELFAILSAQIGRQRKVYNLPKWLFNFALVLTHQFYNIRGLEGGLNFKVLSRLITKKLYLSVPSSKGKSDQNSGIMKKAFRETLDF